MLEDEIEEAYDYWNGLATIHFYHGLIGIVHFFILPVFIFESAGCMMYPICRIGIIDN
jgi:Na+/H+ antiporter NhaA